jgi:hypothetical protein
MGRRGDALARRETVEAIARGRYVPPFWSAIIAAALDGRAAALDWLERAFEQHDVWLVWLGTDPRFDCLRADERFEQLLARIGLAHAPLSSSAPARAALTAAVPARFSAPNRAPRQHLRGARSPEPRPPAS